MVQSSFFSDTPNYATSYPTQNDSNTNPVDGNQTAPSSFYPDGGVYEQANPDAALNYATQAAASAASAASHDASSATHDTNSATSATAAAASAADAASHDSSAAGHDTSAAAHDASAGTHDTNSAASATAAASSATAANTSATNAANSATAANTSATNAANSATAASGSASAAATSATNSAASATAAANSAANAASAATTAANAAVAPLVGAIVFQGTWNASTNSPALASGTGTKGWLYKVSVAGSTAIDGISQWNVGDSIVFDGTTWDKIDGIATEVLSVAGRTGAVTLAVGDVSGAAPLASPALTGTPTAPTATALNNSTQLATTAYADAAVGVEKTRAQAAEALLAPLASPALTGAPTAPTATVGTNTTQVATTAFVLANASAAAVLRSYLAGLTLSTAGSSSTFSVAPGVAADSTNALVMNLASAMSKTTGAWVAGTGNGALDTGSIAASTWYHAHLIAKPGGTNVDVLVSLSATAPTLPSGYTLFRRIGAMKTNVSSQWTSFTQIGDKFWWAVPAVDANGLSVSTSRVLLTLSVPPSVNCEANIYAAVADAGSGEFFWLGPTFVPDAAVTNGGSPGYVAFTLTHSVQTGIGQINVETDTSAQIAMRGSAAGTVYIFTQGWIDRRARDN